MPASWCASPFVYRRRLTREVRVGEVGIGATNPIRVQSMTTPATTDTAATVAQITRLVEAGCEIVRLTVPTSADARALAEIRRELSARKIRVPLVADIHFSPAAALKAVEHVEKIRINPGNYADRKQFTRREYTDEQYASELSRLSDTFRPLVVRAKELGVAMRIGTNHGSLSDRIVNRYGDSPLGMVESALEFVHICEAEGYRDLVVSMKSSNPVVTIVAYRLLAARMAQEGMTYPFHLGVTEAGDGADGRIKSAIGIGSLLDDGIGDTVRVSLTEDPVAEIPVALALVEPYNSRRTAGSTEDECASGVSRRGPMLVAEPPAPPAGSPGRATSRAIPAGQLSRSSSGDTHGLETPFDPFAHSRRRSRCVRFGSCAVGGEEPVRVEIELGAAPGDLSGLRAELDTLGGSGAEEDARPDLVEVRAGSWQDVCDLRAARDALAASGLAAALSVRLSLPLARRVIEECSRTSLGAAQGGGARPAASRRGSQDRAWEEAGGANGGDRSEDRGRVLPLITSAADRISMPAAAVPESGQGPRLSPLALPGRLGLPLLLEGSTEELLSLLAGAAEGDRDESGDSGSPAEKARSGRDLGCALALAIRDASPDPAKDRAQSIEERPGAPHNGEEPRRRSSAVHQHRRLAAAMAALDLDLPVVLAYDVSAHPGRDRLLGPSLVIGSLLCDGIGDAVALRERSPAASREFAFDILQAARVRISKADFISCPSCGRTLFDLEETTRRIKTRTAHLKGLKIAIMGCIVNGPGEMADADFGYVGWGPGKIALFVGKHMVARNIPVEEADERLIALIKEHGKWREPARAEEAAR